MNNLALLLENGAEGVDANPVRSVELYRRAMEERRSEHAVVNLVRLLSKGTKGVTRDRARPIELYSRVTEQGTNASQIRIATNEMETLRDTTRFKRHKCR